MPRYLRRELPGRISYKGEELKPLDLPALPAILDDFRQEGVEAVAICFLHSYANMSHEQAALAEVQRLWPGVSVVSSHQITREWREYERTNTAVLSAYVQPTAERYLSRLHSGPDETQGFDEPALHHAVELRRRFARVASEQIPITMVESGPASGFWGAAELGKLIGEPECARARHRRHHRQMLADRERRGQDQDRLLDRARPQRRPATRSWCRWSTWSRSAMAAARSPGSTISASSMSARNRPAPCRAPPPMAAAAPRPPPPTPISALGRINRDYFCGGEIVADMAAVEAALDAVGEKLGVDADEAARGIIRIANNNMVNALKLVSLNRGHDPRDFTLVAFGGGGGMHGVALPPSSASRRSSCRPAPRCSRPGA